MKVTALKTWVRINVQGLLDGQRNAVQGVPCSCIGHPAGTDREGQEQEKSPHDQKDAATHKVPATRRLHMTQLIMSKLLNLK